MRLTEERSRLVRDVAEQALVKLVAGNETEQGKGGCLQVFHVTPVPCNRGSITTPEPLFACCFDGVNRGKMEKYIRFATEKALRLYGGFFNEQHRASCQSRDRATEKYAGAITVCARHGEGRISEWIILSFSGLSELMDHELVIRIAEGLREHGWDIEDDLDVLRKLAPLSD